VNDASPGFSVWTETAPDAAAGWFFVLPGVYGVTPDGRPFSGLAIELCYGVAISWDGRVICHCTSIMSRVTGDTQSPTIEENHVDGTFCAAKARVIDHGIFVSKRSRDDLLEAARGYGSGSDDSDEEEIEAAKSAAAVLPVTAITVGKFYVHSSEVDKPWYRRCCCLH
jgi:hypothetical protein